MGYITDYELRIDNNDLWRNNAFIADFSNITSLHCTQWIGECKWYDHDDDIIKLSKLYPKTLFTLRGIGEDEDQPWVTYYKNGQYHNAEVKIVIEDFNESKLKDG